jgi:hypothetical protein
VALAWTRGCHDGPFGIKKEIFLNPDPFLAVIPGVGTRREVAG